MVHWKFWKKQGEYFYPKAKPGSEIEEASSNEMRLYLGLEALIIVFVVFSGFIVEVLNSYIGNFLVTYVFVAVLLVIVFLLVCLGYYKLRLRAMSKTNIGDLIEGTVALKDGGYHKFHFNIGKYTQIQELELAKLKLPSKIKRLAKKGLLYLVEALHRKGKCYENFLVATVQPLQQHIVKDETATVYYGIIGVDASVAPISFKEIGFGKNDIPILRITDSAVTRADEELIKASPALVKSSVDGHDIWEATKWRGMYDLKCRELETCEKMRKEALKKGEERKKKREEQSEITEPGGEPKPSKLKTRILDIIVTAVVTALVVAALLVIF